MITFGERLKYYRKKAGLTQEEFSELIDRTPHHVSDMERGVSFPSLPIFYNICKILDVPADCFFIKDDRLFAEFSVFRAAGILEEYSSEDLRKVFDIIHAMREILKEEE